MNNIELLSILIRKVQSVGRAAAGRAIVDALLLLCVATSALAQITISPTTLAPSTVNISYPPVTLIASGGTGAIDWSIPAGAAPSGMNLDAASGLLNGTPSASGTFNFTVRATDSTAAFGEQDFTLVINATPVITTTSPLPSGNLTVPYSQTFAASGGTAPLTWSRVTGALPSGLTLNPATGVLSGTPTVPGISSFTMRATDSTGAISAPPKSFTLAVGVLPLTISAPFTLPASTVGAPGLYSQTLHATGGTGSYTWSIVSGAPPAGITLSSAGVLSGTPTAPATPANFNVQVSDGVDTPDNRAFTLTINPAIAVTTASPLPATTDGATYSQTLAATGGTGGLAWAVTSGALPAGLTLSAAGAITGASTAAGASAFTATATDTVGATGSKAFSLTVNPPINITTASPLPSSTVGVSYPAQTLAATGGTGALTWTITTGSLQPGLTLSAATGVISGTPTTAETRNFTVNAADTAGANAQKSFSLTTNPGLTITTTSPLPPWSVGRAYSQTLTPANGTPAYTFSDPGATLPAWLSLDATGKLTGTPTVANTYNFTLRVTDSVSATFDKAFSVTINAAPAITTASPLAETTIGIAYSQTFAASGGTTPLTWSAPGLPAGLSLDANSGLLSGTPTSSATFNFTVTATDTAGATGSKAFSLTVNAAITVTTASPLPSSTIGVAYPPQTIAASGGAGALLWSVSVGSLQPGLTLNAVTGVIGGTPTTAETRVFTVRATDTVGAFGTKDFSLTTNAAVAISTTSPLPAWTVGRAYSQTVAATGGTTPYTFTDPGATLPAWLALSASGALTGTPTAPGTFNFSVRATDSVGAFASKAFSVTIASAPSVTTASPLAASTAGVAYAPRTLTATGGTAPLSWAATGLPASLVLNPATGVLSGTPLSAGLFTLTATVTDSAGASDAKALDLTINPAITITTTSPLPASATGVAYGPVTLAASGGTSTLTWSVTGGALPAGLTLSSGGLISGSATAGGAFSFTAQALDTAGATASKVFSITISSGLTITNACPLPPWTLGRPYAQTLVAVGGTAPYSFSDPGATLPAWLKLIGAALSGTPPSAGAFNFSVRVTDAATASVDKPCGVTINAVPAVPAQTLPAASVGVAYSGAVLVTSGTAPFTWTATGLPAGVAINTSTGVVSGTPSAGGSFNVTVGVTDAAGATDSRILALSVGTKVTITTAAPLPAWTSGQLYSQTLVAAGGTTPIVWSGSGVPKGLTLDTATGVISGTPANSGAFIVTIRATDSLGAFEAKDFPLTINPPPTIANDTVLPGGAIGQPYIQPLTPLNGTPPYAWSDPGASLPKWLTLNPVTGLLSGTPPAAGTFHFSVRLKDAADALVDKAFSLIAGGAPVVSTKSLPDGTAGAFYSQTLAATGGTGALVWSATGLPANGLSLSPAGVVSGTPAAGTANFTVLVTDSTNLSSAPQALSVRVNAPGGEPVMVTACPLPESTAGLLYERTLTAAGGFPPYAWSSVGLPAALTLDAQSGLVSGTPGASTYAFVVRVRDSHQQNAVSACSLTINPTPLVTSTVLPNGTVGAFYSSRLAAKGGTGSRRWSADGLPLLGLSLDVNGVLSGTPNASGTIHLTTQVTDSLGVTSPSKSFTVTITQPGSQPPIITSACPLPQTTVSSAYLATLTAAGGFPSYSWTAAGLPPGLALDPLNGTVSGAATAAGRFGFLLRVQDQRQQTAARPCHVVINAAPRVSTSALADGTAGVYYWQRLIAVGGTGRLSWSATGLPPLGLHLDSSGILSGRPAVDGSATFTVQVSDSLGVTSAPQTLTVTVTQPGNQPLITTVCPLAPSTESVTYVQTLTAAHGFPPYTWSAPILPTGMTVDAASGVLSGAPAAGPYSLSIQLTDAHQQTAKAACGLSINPVPAVLTTSLPGGTAGAYYWQQLAAANGTGDLTWTATGLPSQGLDLDETGVISGAPIFTGSITFTAQVTDSLGVASAPSSAITIVISPPGTPSGPLSITTPADLPPAAIGLHYANFFAASGGVPPYTWSAFGLPPELTIDPTTGVLSGTLPTRRTVTFTVQVTDSIDATASGSFTLEAFEGGGGSGGTGALAITTTTVSSGSVGVAYSDRIAISGGTAPYTFTVADGALPPGVGLDPVAGTLAGAPAAAGSFAFTVQVADSAGAQVRAGFRIVVAPQPLSIATALLEDGTVGTAYAKQVVASGGTAPYAWSVTDGTLPDGLHLDANAGQITGVPTKRGAFTFQLRVTDATQAFAENQFTVAVALPPAPATTIGGLGSTATPAQQVNISVSLAADYPVDIAGTLTVTFTPDPDVGVDDPEVQFATGASVGFHILAKTRQAVFDPGAALLQVGTVAGTITVTATLNAQDTDIMPGVPPATESKVTQKAPGIVGTPRATRNATGFEVAVTGFSTTRKVTSAKFHFTAKAGAVLSTNDVTLQVADEFSAWFQNPASLDTGGQFTFTQQFTLQGDISAVVAVEVTLTNAQGTSQAVTVTF